MKDIGASIQHLREEKGYTQDQLAEKLFVSRQTISNYERNKSQPSLEMLERIAEVFEVDMASLLTEPTNLNSEKNGKVWHLFLQGAICLLLDAAYIVLRRMALTMRNEKYDVGLLAWVYFLLRPGLWAALGYFFMSTLLTATKVPVRKRKWFRALRVLIWIVVAAYLALIYPHLPLPQLLEVSRAYSLFGYWLIVTTPNDFFPQAYLVVAFAIGAALRICHTGCGWRENERDAE